MEPREQKEIGERVVALEEGFKDLAAAIERLDKSIHSLQNTMHAGARTPWGHIWSAAGVIIVVLGGFFNLLYQPLKMQVEQTREIAESNRRSIEVTTAKLAEVETQFHGKYEVSNLQVQTLYQTNNLQVQTLYQLLNAVLRMHKLDPIDQPQFWPAPQYWPSSPGERRR